ncbi:MAG: acetamidase/formamidase family protein [Thermoprotei archaeon]
MSELKQLDGFAPENVHFKWSAKNEPIATLDEGEEILVKVPDSSMSQVEENWTTDDLKRLDESRFDGAVGPIFVKGAKKGMALEVEIEEIRPGSWGWSAIMNDFGLLKGAFKERLVTWEIGPNFAVTKGDFLRGIKVPLNPFLGVVGVAPEKGEYPMIPPQRFGGNMDNRLLSVGTRLLLPIEVDGALLSISDPHASQGDGEICGTAIETAADVKMRVRVRDDLKLSYPIAYAPAQKMIGGELLVAMGISSELNEALISSVKNMIETLVQLGFAPDEAYVFMSVAGELRISEAVDEPNFVVSSILAKRLIARSRSTASHSGSLARIPRGQSSPA